MTNTTLVQTTRALSFCGVLLIGAGAFAQYTGEFVICIDGSSPDNCRASALAVQNDGSIIWGGTWAPTFAPGSGSSPGIPTVSSPALPNGEFSLMPIRSTCFEDVGPCQNFVLTDITP
jgi:hypothetical protein